MKIVDTSTKLRSLTWWNKIKEQILKQLFGAVCEGKSWRLPGENIQEGSHPQCLRECEYGVMVATCALGAHAVRRGDSSSSTRTQNSKVEVKKFYRMLHSLIEVCLIWIDSNRWRLLPMSCEELVT